MKRFKAQQLKPGTLLKARRFIGISAYGYKIKLDDIIMFVSMEKKEGFTILVPHFILPNGKKRSLPEILVEEAFEIVENEQFN